MVMCNSPCGFQNICVASMDGQQSHGGTICCDTAEDLDFQEEDILKQCEYAKKEEITDVAKEHSINNVEFEIRAQMYSFSSETSVITVKEIENATKLFTEMCKEYENVQMKKIKKNMKLNKFELNRFALRAESTIFPTGRLDCINGNFHTEDAKEFMEYYKITYAE